MYITPLPKIPLGLLCRGMIESVLRLWVQVKNNQVLLYPHVKPIDCCAMERLELHIKNLNISIMQIPMRYLMS